MFEPEVFRKQMYCVEESTCDNTGIFRRPRQSFGAPTVIWRLGNCAPLVPPRYVEAPLIYMKWIDSHSRVEEVITFVSCRINRSLLQTIRYC